MRKLGIPYSPISRIQNLIFIEFLMNTTSVNELWINVKKVGGKWTIGGTKQLTDFEADWAPGQPSG